MHSTILSNPSSRGHDWCRDLRERVDGNPRTCVPNLTCSGSAHLSRKLRRHVPRGRRCWTRGATTSRPIAVLCIVALQDMAQAEAHLHVRSISVSALTDEDDLDPLRGTSCLGTPPGSNAWPWTLQVRPPEIPSTPSCIGRGMNPTLRLERSTTSIFSALLQPFKTRSSDRPRFLLWSQRNRVERGVLEHIDSSPPPAARM